MTLEKRPFAATGKSVSVLGLGTVKFGRNTGVKYPGGDGFSLPTDDDISRLLDLCLDHGINLIDTAPAYGSAEERLGKLLGSKRDEFFVVTKTGEEFSGEKSEYFFDAGHTRTSVERSLARLKTHYLDCVLVHAPKEDVAVIRDTDVIETLQNLKTEGKILSFGVSVNTLSGGLLAVEAADAVMVSYNKDYTSERATIEAAAKKGRAVLVKKGLGSGHIADSAEAVRFAVGTPGVTSLVFGSLNPANILSNINALIKS